MASFSYLKSCLFCKRQPVMDNPGQGEESLCSRCDNIIETKIKQVIEENRQGVRSEISNIIKKGVNHE